MKKNRELRYERPNPWTPRLALKSWGTCALLLLSLRRDDSLGQQAFCVRKVFVRIHDLRIARNRDERLLQADTEEAVMPAHDTQTAIIMSDGIQYACHNAMRLGQD
jgi:hypothetical protein